MNLVYAAKPRYGGWVSFTAHLCLKYNANLYKIGNNTETKKRPYGYNVEYQNIDAVELINKPNLIITAIDKNYYKYLNLFPDNTVIVIHDPTEVKGKSCQPVIDNLARFKVVTIRQTVQKFLKEKYDIESEFLHHPFYEYPKKIGFKNKAVSISRIDYDKHTEIILEANEKLSHPIDIYGAKNDLYVYRKLKEMNLDLLYKGRFDKSFEAVNNILKDAKFVVDMSAIKNDGGGSQYTFLEAIYEECALVLSNKWVNGVNSEYKNNYNCFIVSNSDELVSVILNSENTSNIIDNANKLLKPHVDVNWSKLFSK